MSFLRKKRVYRIIKQPIGGSQWHNNNGICAYFPHISAGLINPKTCLIHPDALLLGSFHTYDSPFEVVDGFKDKNTLNICTSKNSLCPKSPLLQVMISTAYCPFKKCCCIHKDYPVLIPGSLFRIFSLRILSTHFPLLYTVMIFKTVSSGLLI